MKLNRASLLCGGRRRKADEISELPDEIIHEILERLHSPKEAAKSTILSRRWKHIWRSYPILEFHSDDRDYSAKLKSFLAAAARKLSSSQHSRIKAVRISAGCPDFIGDMLDLIVNREPEYIDIFCRHDSSGLLRRITAPHLIGKNLRFRILKLSYCFYFKESAPTNHPEIMMTNLRVLHLSHCIIDELVLNALIAGVPVLEELKLWAPCRFYRRLRICNKPNLKTLELGRCSFDELLEITGTESLQVLSITDSQILGVLDISPSALSSIKSLNMEAAGFLTADVIDDLISKLASVLQSISVCRFGEVREVEVPSQVLRKLRLELCFCLAMVDDGPPSVVDFHYRGDEVDVRIESTYNRGFHLHNNAVDALFGISASEEI